MIYLDSSVAIAHVLAEPRRPSDDFWLQPMASSRLLEFEVWNRLHALGASAYRVAKARDLLEVVQLIEMTRLTLGRALQSFPVKVRTLDGLHLAAMDHLRGNGIPTTLASYDRRLLEAADAMRFQTVQP